MSVAIDQSGSERAAARLTALLEYYGECLEAEANLGVRARLDEDSDWLELPICSIRQLDDSVPLRLGADEPRRFLEQHTGHVLCGYPVLVRLASGKRPGQLIPAVVRSGTLSRIADEWQVNIDQTPAQLNPDFLRQFARTPEEQRLCYRALRRVINDVGALAALLNSENLVPVVEVVDEALPAAPFAPTRAGLYNRALLFAPTMNPFTSGLRKELAELAMQTPLRHTTALSTLFGLSEDARSDESLVIVEPLPLNDEQRAAVASAFRAPLTVVTGPPGTGKSRVVLSVLATAFIHGQRALFASRNHKALEVVERRLRELAGHPILLRGGVRSGDRDLRHECAELIGQLLTRPSGARPMPQLARLMREYAEFLRSRERIDALLCGTADDVPRGPPVDPVSGRSWLPRWSLLHRRAFRSGRALGEPLTGPASPPPVRHERTPEERRRLARAWHHTSTRLSAKGVALLQAHVAALSARMYGPLRQSLAEYRSMLKRITNDRIGGTAREELAHALRESFVEVTDGLPIWSVANLSVHQLAPLAPAIFDLVIIDEAAQCDIPSAFPLLHRARRALIIGDPLQLKHIATLPAEHDQALQLRHALTNPADQPFTYVEHSLFDLAASRADAAILHLIEHHRSDAAIAEFSNRQWYRRALRVVTDHRALKRPRGWRPVSWVNAVGPATAPRAGSAAVDAEVEGIAGLLEEVQADGYGGSVGIVAPFRAQVAALRERITASFDAEWLQQHAVTIATAHGYQGDERDVILFSLCLTADMPEGPRHFLRSTEHLLNVAVSRARAALVVVGNREAALSADIPAIKSLAEYIGDQAQAHESTGRQPVPEGPLERRLFEGLQAAGLQPVAQLPVDQYVLDMAITNEDKKLDIEVDGEAYHLDSLGGQNRHDVLRDARLEEAGWTVLRFWANDVQDDPDGCVRRVRRALAGSPPL